MNTHPDTHPQPDAGVPSGSAPLRLARARQLRGRSVMLLAMLAAAAAVPVAIGTMPAAAASSQATSRPNVPTFSGVTGPGCKQNASETFSEHGKSIVVHTGSLRADGCDGAFRAMPMSGHAAKDNPANYATWTFHTGAVKRGVCHVSVWTPNDSSIKHAGGHPAYYQVFTSARATGTAAGSFVIDQQFNRKRWASRGNYRITGGALTVKLHSRGVKAKAGARIAVAAVRITCEP